MKNSEKIKFSSPITSRSIAINMTVYCTSIKLFDNLIPQVVQLTGIYLPILFFGPSALSGCKPVRLSYFPSKQDIIKHKNAETK